TVAASTSTKLSSVQTTTTTNSPLPPRPTPRAPAPPMLPLHCVLCSPRSTPDRSVTLQGAPLTLEWRPAAMCAIVRNVSNPPKGSPAMTTMQATARHLTEQQRALARARATLATTHLGTLRAHSNDMGARSWEANTFYLIDAAHGQRVADAIRAAARAAVPSSTPRADVLPACRAYWATVLPMTAATACDACEDDHPAAILADGSVICAREGDR